MIGDRETTAGGELLSERASKGLPWAEQKNASVESVVVDGPRERLAAALAAALGPDQDDVWRTLVAALTLLGSERLEGWKSIAAGIGVSITRARELADPRRSFRLPVRYGVRGVYVTRLALALWLAQYDAPYGGHDQLKRAAVLPSPSSDQ